MNALLSKLKGAAEQLQSGTPPAARESVADSLVHVLFRMIDAYVLDAGPLGAELDNLVRQASNPDDPTIRGLGFVERQQLRLFLMALKKAKEATRGKKEEG